MKNSFLKRLGFTLIELLVVISIIGILASLAIPAVTGALVRGQMTGTLNNTRQLQLATFNANLDQETAGQLGAWPGAASNSVASTFPFWVGVLTNGYLSTNDLLKMLSAPRVAVTNIPTTAAETAFNVYQVGNVVEDSSIFLSSRNWDATAPATAPLATAQPFGDKGVVVMRKGGDGAIIQQRFITNSAATPVSTNQPAKLP
jgi:prepilin-type N-terminal cleavage/methylation domain-containing protein